MRMAFSSIARSSYGRIPRWLAVILSVKTLAAAPGCDWPAGVAIIIGSEPAFNVLAEEFQPIVVSGPPIFRERPIFDEILGRVGHHSATITAFSDGELMAAWYSYSGPGELDGSAIYTARQSAGSRQWEAPRLHIDRDVSDGNPVLYSEAESVWLFQAVVPFGWSTAHIEVQRSSDRGKTWTSPQTIAGPFGSNVRYPPLRLEDGRLLLPAYDDLLQRALFFASVDGVTWELTSIVGGELTQRPIQPSVVQLDDGRLLSVMRNSGGDWLWIMASGDGGRSWSRPADSGFPNPGSPAAFLKLASGNLMLVYNDSRTERRPLCVALSANGGLTWLHHRILIDGEENYSYPSVTQSSDGLIHIVYSLARRRIQHVTINEAWIVE